VPVAAGVSEEQRNKLLRVLQRLSDPYLYTSHPVWSRIGQRVRDQGEAAYRALRRRTVLSDDIEDVSTPGRAASCSRDDVAFVQFSSGSTSEPKGVVLTHDNLLTNIRDIQHAAAFTEDDVSLSWMPLTHDMGLIGFHLNMLLSGMDHCLMATEAFIRRPLLWLQAASEQRANVLCSPNFGYRHFLKSFSADKLAGVDLSQVRLIFNGAEPISPSLCAEFLGALAPFGLPAASMFPVYGLAEASLAVSFPSLDRTFRSRRLDRARLGYGDAVRLDGDDAVEHVCVGRPIGDCKVRIAGDGERELSAGTVGRILISGRNVTAGFYRAGGVDREGFTTGGWLDTGDLGFMLDGELYITGRAKDIIFANGQNFYAHDLEAVAARMDGLDLGKVAVGAHRDAASGGDEIILFILHRGEPESFAPLATAASAFLTEHSGAEVACVVPVKRIPKTTSGKIQRFALEQAYEAGEFDAALAQLAALQPHRDGGEALSTTETLLQEICNRVLGEQQRLGRNDNFFEIGANSLKLIEIHEQIDARFPDRLEVTDLFDYPTLAELATYLDKQQVSAV
jgi:acyl-CoA synthetase (AMP-forming)/AMP-acid ligase II/acyl carrier protein